MLGPGSEALSLPEGLEFYSGLSAALVPQLADALALEREPLCAPEVPESGNPLAIGHCKPWRQQQQLA